MNIFVLNTAQGLKPLYDDDYEEKKKLKIGEMYRANIKLSRNPGFHRKFFKMINIAWGNSEKAQTEFANEEAFRYSLIIKAGYFKVIYQTKDQAVVKPDSIAFDNMDDSKFEDVYNDVLDVIIAEYVPIDKQDFLNEMVGFGF